MSECHFLSSEQDLNDPQLFQAVVTNTEQYMALYGKPFQMACHNDPLEGAKFLNYYPHSPDALCSADGLVEDDTLGVDTLVEDDNLTLIDAGESVFAVSIGPENLARDLQIWLFSPGKRAQYGRIAEMVISIVGDDGEGVDDIVYSLGVDGRAWTKDLAVNNWKRLQDEGLEELNFIIRYGQPY